MKRKMYESPVLEFFGVTLEQTFLSNVRSVEKMNEIDGEWDEV